ncbi:hypothetical protein NFI96_012344, partial [Prochilodus magdalenae]
NVKLIYIKTCAHISPVSHLFLTAPDSFSYKKFFQLCGLTQKTPQEVKDVFRILDEDNSGFIEESELKFFLQRFVPGARTLTEKEAKSFISAADDDSDGRIGVEGTSLTIMLFLCLQEKK